MLIVIAVTLLAACDSRGAPADASDRLDGASNQTPDAARVPDADPCDGALCDAAPDAGTELAMSNVIIEHNLNSVLSCYVSWETNVPATSVVEFGPSQTYSYRIADDTLVTDHRVLVIGLTAETLIHLRALSVAGDLQESTTGDLTYQTGTLPDPVAASSIVAHDPARVQPGWTLTNVRYNSACAAVAFDMSGEPVWYYVVPGSDTPNLDLTLVQGGRHVLVGLTQGDEAVEVNLAGDVVWVGPTKTPERRAHHHYEKLPSGNYLTLLNEEQGGVTGDIIEILAPSHSPVWSWNAFDHLPVGTGDWTHANAAIADLNNSWMYFNSRSLSTLFKIDMSDGHVIWAFGEGGGFIPDPLAAFPWTDAQHSPKILSNGNILFYDNGTARGFTRLVEYRIDETLMTTSIIWEFPGDASGLNPWYTTSWYTASRGEVDRLPNGNTLVSSTADGFVFEVTPDRTVVWEMHLPSTHTGTFKSERITPPLIEEL